MFMAFLDIQIVSSSLTEIQAGLSASADEIPWVQTAYLIAEVIAIPLSGFLSRALGTRILFATAAVLALGPVMVGAVGGSLVLMFLAALRARLGPAMTLLNVLLALAGNVVGVWRAFHGERAITWEPPLSARGIGVARQKAGR